MLARALRFLLKSLPSLVLLALALGGGWVMASRMLLTEAEREGRHRAEMHAANLGATLEQYRYLPYVLALNQDILNLLADPRNPRRVEALNRYLEQVNRQSRTSALFIVNVDGIALASSNWMSPYSFVGNSYAFRPYFQQALAGQSGSFYGIGSTSREPGYFLSWPVLSGRRVVGVAVVKVSLAPLEEAWRKGAEPVLVSDRHGVAFLSANPDWKFATLQPLPPTVRRQIDATRQYLGAKLHPFALLQPHTGWRQQAWLAPDSERKLLAGRYLQIRQTLPQTGWTLTLLVDMHGRNLTLLAIMSTLLASGLGLLTLWHYWRLRLRRLREQLAAQQALQQAHDQLERKVAERTRDLALSNTQLSAEIRERIQTENSLRITRGQLAEASKLAALGQMAAGVAHEINQPLAALRAFADNAVTLLQRGRSDAASDNLGQISQLVERIAHITRDLKTFARRHRGPLGQTNPLSALQDTLTLLQPALREARVALELDLPPRCPDIACDAIGLEQVFTNLLGNAIDAMRPQPQGRLEISLLHKAGMLEFRLRDHGPGIADADLPHLFEPFYSTKPRGQGLGLGLAIVQEIVEQSGGRIEAGNHPEGGACFIINWPCESTP